MKSIEFFESVVVLRYTMEAKKNAFVWGRVVPRLTPETGTLAAEGISLLHTSSRGEM